MKENRFLYRGKSPYRESGLEVPEFNKDYGMMDFIKLFASEENTYGLKADGTLWGTGLNAAGELGLGDTVKRHMFELIPGIADVKDVICGLNHTFIITNNGEVFSAGKNNAGQLGLGDNENRSTFTKVNITNVKRIECGANHTAMINTSNEIYTCGRNTEGQLGLGNTTNVNTFTKVNVTNVTDFACGGNHMLVLLNTGELQGVGMNSKGQLGLNNLVNQNTLTKINVLTTIADISCGFYHSIVVYRDGSCVATGDNTYGQLGIGSTTQARVFTTVNLSNVKECRGDKYNTVLITHDHKVYVNGKNDMGQLGLGDIENKTNPVEFTNYDGSLTIKYCDTFSIINQKNMAPRWSGVTQYKNRLGLLNPLTTDSKGVYIPFKNDIISGYSNILELNGQSLLKKEDGSFIVLEKEDRLISGNQSMFLLKSSGELYAAGTNSKGELGLGDTNSRNKLTKVDITDVKDVICGHQHTFIIKNNGDIFSTGDNAYGQLGLGNNTNMNVFTKVNFSGIEKISCGGEFTIAIKNNNEVYFCGGITGGHSSKNFKKITGTPSDIKDVVCGRRHVLILTYNGELYGCGGSSNGELGLGSTASVSNFTKINVTDVDQVITHSSASHTFIIRKNGEILSAGDNSSGQLGQATTNPAARSFAKIYDAKINEGVRDIYCTPNATFLISNNGSLYSCGYNNVGQLGLGHTDNKNAFQKVNNVKNVKCVEGIYNLVFMFDEKGTLYYSGYGRALNYIDSRAFTAVAFNIKKIACGKNHTVVLTDNGKVFGCGENNENGQLGLGVLSTSSVLIELPIDDVKDISCGYHHTMFIKNNGDLYACGKNYDSQLGLGDNVDKRVPTKVDVIDVDQVICGYNHTFIIKTNGEVYACGKNDYGQLGLGDRNTRSKFTKINIDNVKKISCGYNTTVVLKNNGEIYACGWNGTGQLGLGDINVFPTFTKANIEGIFTNIFTGYDNTYIIREDGRLFGAGDNTAGQLGKSISTSKFVYFTDLGIDNVKEVAAGESHCIALTYNGEAYGTGENPVGQLGIGHYTNVDKFTKVKISDVKLVVSGVNFTFLIKTNGDIQGTGLNNRGQLGISSSTNVNVPTKMPVAKAGFDFLEPINSEPINQVDKCYNNIIINNKYLVSDEYRNLSTTLGVGFKDKYEYNGEIPTLPLENIKRCSISKTHSLILLNDGTVYGCGSNQYRELLFPSATTKLTEQTKLQISGIRDVACGEYFSYFVGTDGILYASGTNSNGQLGQGNINLYDGLQTVEGISNVKRVFCGERFTFVILNDNSLWVCGRNEKGLLGLGAEQIDQNITTFTKIDVDVEEVEINRNHIILRKTDKSVWVCGMDRKDLNLTDPTNLHIFQKVRIPSEFDLKLTNLNILSDSIGMVFEAPTQKSSIELVSKSISALNIKVNDEYDVVSKIELYINSEVVSTMNDNIGDNVTITIPKEKINLGINNIYVKATTMEGNVSMVAVTIDKIANGITAVKDKDVMIKGKKYSIASFVDNPDNVTVTLDRPIEDPLYAGDIFYQLINELEVFIKTNGSGEFKPLVFTGFKKVETGYQEMYELTEEGIKSAEVKIVVTDGDKWTAVKRPSMLFKLSDQI